MSEAKAERSSPNPDHGNTDSGYLCAEQLAIVERFEHCIDYLYPVLLGIRRAHHVVRDATVSALFAQVQLFAEAGKSASVSRLYAADANLALLLFYLRFLSSPKRKLISQHQHQVAAVHIAETGRMLGAWIARAQRTAKRPAG